MTSPLHLKVDPGSSSTSMIQKKRKSSEIERSSNNNTNIAPNVYDILQARSSLDGYTSLVTVFQKIQFFQETHASLYILVHLYFL